MIEYILEATKVGWETKSSIDKKKKSSKYERLHHRIDDQIKYCPSCELTWKKNRKMYIRDFEYFPKNHIPIIGKEKTKCPKCKEKNNNG
tara:strand:+ start:297 stop:563 length:267 start_codon:yes stop_codon:yes gene_type:complete